MFLHQEPDLACISFFFYFTSAHFNLAGRMHFSFFSLAALNFSCFFFRNELRLLSFFFFFGNVFRSSSFSVVGVSVVVVGGGGGGGHPQPPTPK